MIRVEKVACADYRDVEELLTNLANGTLSKVCGSWLGRWLSQKLADEIGKALSEK